MRIYITCSLSCDRLFPYKKTIQSNRDFSLRLWMVFAASDYSS